MAEGSRHNIGTTHTAVRAWASKAPAGAELRAGKGLYLRKTAAGAHWVYRYRSPETGNQVRVNLWGDDPQGALCFPDASLEEATARAAALRAQVSAGRDPQALAERARAAEAAAQVEAREVAARALEAAARRLTVRQVFERWRDAELKPRTRADGSRMGRKDGGKQCADQFERYLMPAHGARLLEELTRADVLGVVDKALAAGHQRLASMLYADLRQMWLFALAREIASTDPFAGLKRSRVVGAPVARDRALSREEIKTLATALPASDLGARSVCAVWLTLATGVRVGELSGAVWADALPDGPKPRAAKLKELQAIADDVGVKLGIVDTDAATWHLPDTKNGRDHTVHLSAFALAQFDALRQARPEPDDNGKPSPWCWPGRPQAQPVASSTLGKMLADRQRPAGGKLLAGRTRAHDALILPGGRWTCHDLRRTAGTLMGELGVSGDVIDECLNHLVEGRVRRTYVRTRREADQARAFDQLGALLHSLKDGPTNE